MFLNVEEAKQKSIELINQKSYSFYYSGFSGYSTIYPDTTENLSYLEQIDVKNKEVLTVTGSFDQCLNLACLGAKKIHNIDTNVLSVFYAGLKYAALQAFSYEDYISFFLEENRLDYQMYLRLRQYLGVPFREYWDFVYQAVSYSNQTLAKSHLFYSFGSKENLILSNPYLKSEENYNQTKENMKNIKITFEEGSVLDIGKGEEKYDLMLFSNVESYVVRDAFHSMSEEEYMDFLQNKASRQLKPNGRIQCAYKYTYKYPRLTTLPKNAIKRLFASKYTLDKIDYMEGKCRKVVVMSAPLKGGGSMNPDFMDCAYLYEQEKGRRR